MKRSHALLVLFLLVGSAVASCLHGYSATKTVVECDMERALALTMQEQPSDVITADTIRVFNSHLQLSELRGRATLAVDTRQHHFECYAQCSEATILALSDQRPALLLLSLAAGWGVLCLFWRKREAGNEFGGLCFANGTFTAMATGEEVHLTPMQYQLMELFFRSPRHVLTKTEICEALWPKKDDASETLYTLIRRLKPIVEQHSKLHIASDRGKSYRLTTK